MSCRIIPFQACQAALFPSYRSPHGSNPPMWMKCHWFIRLAYDYWTPLSQRGTSEEGEGPGVRALGGISEQDGRPCPSSDLSPNTSHMSHMSHPSDTPIAVDRKFSSNENF